MLRQVCAALWFVGLASIFACTQGGGGSKPNTLAPSAFVGRACNVDSECGSLRCDSVRHQCICLSDDSCKSSNPADPPRYCNNFTGLCVDSISGCTQAEDCASGEFCDASTRSCRTLKSFCAPCSADSECGGNEDNCVLDSGLQEKFCSKACATTGDCPRGAECVSIDGKQQCWPASNSLKPAETQTCRSFRGCTPDSLRTCNSNAECAELPGQRCDPAQGRCVAIEQVCPFGTVCDPRGKICVAECSVDADCGDPKLRCSRRICEPVGECKSDAQCPADMTCSIAPGATNGECRPFCSVDADCPLGNRCTRSSDNRYRCVPGCTTHSNCPVDQRCNLTTSQCEGPMVGSVRTCQATLACDTCQVCDPQTHACNPARATYPQTCRPCSPSSGGDCPGGACVQMADSMFYCARYCSLQQECAQGFSCLPLTGSAQSACVPANRQCQGKCP